MINENYNEISLQLKINIFHLIYFKIYNVFPVIKAEYSASLFQFPFMGTSNCVP